MLTISCIRPRRAEIDIPAVYWEALADNATAECIRRTSGAVEIVHSVLETGWTRDS